MADRTSLQKHESRSIEPERLRSGRTFIPFADIVEEDNRLLLFADMPGVKHDGLEIEYERGVLTIHGKISPREDQEAKRYVLREYGVGDFYRSFRIGKGVDAAGITAELRGGVLRLELPKAVEARPRRIDVKVS